VRESVGREKGSQVMNFTFIIFPQNLSYLYVSRVGEQGKGNRLFTAFKGGKSLSNDYSYSEEEE
jgi:hypothetical protein